MSRRLKGRLKREGEVAAAVPPWPVSLFFPLLPVPGVGVDLYIILATKPERCQCGSPPAMCIAICCWTGIGYPYGVAGRSAATMSQQDKYGLGQEACRSSYSSALRRGVNRSSDLLECPRISFQYGSSLCRPQGRCGDSEENERSYQLEPLLYPFHCGTSDGHIPTNLN